MTKSKPSVTSPHLQIYKPQLTSILSISHRLAGGTLLAGFLLLALAISWALLSPQSYDAALQMMPQGVVMIPVFLISAAWIYHFLNGIRHLLWDWLIGLELNQVYVSGYGVVALFILIMLGVWL